MSQAQVHTMSDWPRVAASKQMHTTVSRGCLQAVLPQPRLSSCYYCGRLGRTRNPVCRLQSGGLELSEREQRYFDDDSYSLDWPHANETSTAT